MLDEEVCSCHMNQVCAPFVELWVSVLQVEGDVSVSTQKVLVVLFVMSLADFDLLS